MRIRSILALSGALAAWACSGEDNQVASTFDAERDTAPVDTAPQTVATGVAVMLTGENVVALLDTAYVAAENFATLALERGSEDIRPFAELAVARHRTARAELRQVAVDMGISGVLPEDEDLLPAQRAAARALSQARGAQFDSLYIEHSIRIHEELVDEIEDAMDEAEDTPIVEFLRAQRQKINVELQALKELRQGRKAK